MTHRTASVAFSLALVLAGHEAGAARPPFEVCQRPTCQILQIPTAHFSVTPTSLDFGAVGIGTTASLDIVVTNDGGATGQPNFSGGAPNDPTNFGGSQNCAGVPI